MQIERLAFIAFSVADLVRTRNFYAEILGAPVLKQATDWIEFELGGITIRTYLHHGEYRRQHSGLQFIVPDVDSAYKELNAAKTDLRSAIRKEPWGGRVFTVADPDGNIFDILDGSYSSASV